MHRLFTAKHTKQFKIFQSGYEDAQKAFPYYKRARFSCHMVGAFPLVPRRRSFVSRLRLRGQSRIRLRLPYGF